MYEKFSKRVDKIERVGEEHDNQFIRFLEDKKYFDSNLTLEKNKSEVKK